MMSRLSSDRSPAYRAISTAFTLLCLLAFVAGCAPQTAAPAAPAAEEAAAPSEPKAGGTLYIGQDFGPGTLDPHKNIAWASINIYESIYNGLVKWNEDETELVPDLVSGGIGRGHRY
jgi:ABC-type transport system substrate-binding protein